MVLVVIVSVRFAGVRSLKFSLGLDSVYLQIVDVFSKLESKPVDPIFHPRIDLPVSLEGWILDSRKKTHGTFFNLFSGNLMLTETDYEVHPASNGASNPLSLERIYNSGKCYEQSPLGYGWRPFWDVAFSLVNDIYVFKAPTGDLVTFKFVPKENAYTVLKNKWMRYRLEYDIKNNVYNIHGPRGEVFEFPQSEQGNAFRMSRILHANGVAYQTVWDESRGMLKSLVEEKTERTTQFIYDNDRKVITTVVFPSGMEMYYEYDNHLNLVKVSGDQNNYARMYRYENPSNVHYLTASGLDRVRRRFEYDAGKLVSVRHGDYENPVRIDRDPILGTCMITTMNKAQFKISNMGELNVDIEGPGDYSRTLYFDDQGWIAKEIDSQNLSAQYSWDKTFNLIQKQSKNQGVEIFDFDAQHNLVAYTDRQGNVTQYRYDDNRLTRKISPEGEVFKYTYHDGFLETVYMENEKTRKSYRYDNSGLIVLYENEAGDTYSYEYNKDGYLRTKTSPNRWVENYLWRGGKLTEVRYQEIDGNTKKHQAFDYDSAGRLVSIRDYKGDKTLLEYDSVDRVERIIDFSGSEKSYRWTGDGLLASYSENRGDKIDISYDELNRIQSIVLNDKKTWKFDYAKESGIDIRPFSDTFSRVTRPDDRSVAVSYDKNYEIREVKWADGHSESFEYDLEGNLTALIQSPGKRLSYFYDKNNRLEYIYNKNSKDVLICKHNWKGDLVSYTDANSITYDVKRDPRGLPVAISRGLERPFIEWEWDSEFNLTGIKSSSGRKKELYYNLENRILAKYETQKGLTEYEFYPNGNVMSKTDSAGRKVRYIYYPNDLLKSKELVNSGITYEWIYDSSNRPKRVTGPAPYQFTWSDRDELIKLAYDKQKIILIAYSPAGKVIKKTYPGLLIQLNKYNEKGVLENISENGLDPIQFEYDSMGRLYVIKYPNKITTKYEYDSQNRVADISTMDDKGQILFKRSYSYDKQGRVVQITTERDYIKRKFNEDGLMIFESLDDKHNTVSTYEYNANHQIVREHFKNRIEEYDLGYSYDSSSRKLVKIEMTGREIESLEDSQQRMRVDIHGIVNKGAGFLEVDQQVVQIADNKFKVNNVTLKPGTNEIPVHSISSSGREQHYKIKLYFSPFSRKTMAYDETGRRTFRSFKGTNYVYHYNDEGLLETLFKSLGSDMQRIRYDYYANDALCFKETVNDGGGSSGDKIQYLFDENKNLIGEFYVKGSGYKNLYMFGPDGHILYRIDRGHKKYYYHLDKDGSVIGITDHSGAIVCSYSYDAFGNVAHLKQTMAFHNPFLYLGHFYDEDSDFYFHKGYTGPPEEHARYFGKSVAPDYLDRPDRVIKKLFSDYVDNYPNIIEPMMIVEGVSLPSLPELPDAESIKDSDVWLCRK